MKEQSLSGRVILVTGGGSGLGLSMAHDLHSRGATVILNGRDALKLEQAAAQFENNTDRVSWYAADVREEAQIAQMFIDLWQRHGFVDGLINNAAGNFLCCSEDLSSNGFRAVIDIVLQGTFHATLHFGRMLIAAQRPGSIVNIATTYADTGSAFVLPSACAKAGVVALTKSLAVEWADYNIRLNAVAPGPFPTPGAWQRLIPDPKIEQLFKQQVPLKRFGDHHELTAVISFLLSDQASYMSGTVVPVDGAESLKGGQFNFLLESASREELKKLFAAMRGAS